MRLAPLIKTRMLEREGREEMVETEGAGRREQRRKKTEKTLFRGISSPERRGALNFWEIRKIALRQERKGMLPVLREGEI